MIETFNIIAGLASTAGAGLSFWTLREVQRLKRQLVRRERLPELLDQLTDLFKALAGANLAEIPVDRVRSEMLRAVSILDNAIAKLDNHEQARLRPYRTELAEASGSNLLLSEGLGKLTQAITVLDDIVKTQRLES